VAEKALEALGGAIRARREKIDNLSQEGLAERAGLNRTYVSEAERGLRNVSYRNLNKLADALELPLAELIAAAKELENS
jgi:transcriptional regulator with XRE-family HTH domain